MTYVYIILSFLLSTNITVRLGAEESEFFAHFSAAWCSEMGPVRIRHSSHDFGWQSSHSIDLAWWQAEMASIEIWIP